MNSDILLKNELPTYWGTENVKAIQKLKFLKTGEPVDSIPGWIWSLMNIFNRLLTQRQVDFLKLSRIFMILSCTVGYLRVLPHSPYLSLLMD